MSRTVTLFLATRFTMSYQMVKLNIKQAFTSLINHVYVLDKSVTGGSIELVQSAEFGLTFVSSEFAGQLLRRDTLSEFVFVTKLTRQLGFHFAKVTQGLGGDPSHQDYQSFGAHFFGGVLKYAVITAESHIVPFLLDEDTWCTDLKESINKRYPHLIAKVTGIPTPTLNSK